MKRSSRTWWVAFGGCVAFVFAAMGGISVLVLRMERESFVMRAEADRNAELRATLWDMESWLIPHLGREASRPAFEYQAYFPTENVYTRYYSKIAAGDVFTPSPLLTFESPYFPIHFHIDDPGEFRSPQIPQGNALDLAQATLLPEGWLPQRQAALTELEQCFSYEQARLACAIAPDDDVLVIAAGASDAPQQTVDAHIREGQSALGGPWVQELDQIDSPQLQQQRSLQSFNSRQLAQQESQEVLSKNAYGNIAPAETSPVVQPAGIETGPFIAVWVEGAGSESQRLIFVREVRGGKETAYQGFMCDWDAMHRELVMRGRQRFPGLDVVPVREEPSTPHDLEESAAMFRLASLPARIECAPTGLEAARPLLLTPARATLAVAWLFVILAAIAAGLTLRSTIDFANRRSRFASAVTHELRTPLTTFQMYSEMLADGMVRDADQQRVYHQTLREESSRLSAIVENVLAYARVEEGRAARHIERLEIDELFDRVLPPLRRCAEKAGAEMRFDIDEEARRRTIAADVDAVAQILLNLVDNACKYGCDDSGGKSAARIELSARIEDTRLRIEVRDRGPGVAPEVEKSIFRPFERGSIEPGSPMPGVGLGLALSRELATSLGGSLTHCRPRDGEAGACFVLTIPLLGG